MFASSFYITLIFITFSFWTTAQETWKQDAPNWNTEHLKGKVSVIEEKCFIGKEQNGTFTVVKPGWEHTWEDDSKSYFDSIGNLVKVDFYRSGSKFRTEYYKYQNTKLIERFRLYHHSFYEYDALGRVKLERYKFISSKVTTPFTNFTYFYDPAGNLTVKKETDSLNALIGIDSIFYDQQKRPIKMLSYYEGWIDFQLLTYDSDGHIQEHIFGDNEEGLAEKSNYTYENKQLKIEFWTVYADNQPDGVTITYFEDNNPVKVLEQDADGEITNTKTSSYEFDQHGNWIKQTVKNSDDNSVYIMTRRITYF